MEFIRLKLSRIIRIFILCLLSLLFLICTLTFVYNGYPSKVVVLDSSHISQSVTKKPVKHKKTFENVLEKNYKKREFLVRQICNCQTELYQQANLSINSNESISNNRKIQCTEKRFPKALLIGLTKGGTTALMSFLHEHQQIAVRLSMPLDTRFFNYYYKEKSFDWYRNLMPCSYSHQITISRSTEYFFKPDVPGRVRAFDPSMKIIIIVREPTERAMSQYVMWKHQAEYRIGNFSFEDAITTGSNKEIDPLSPLIWGSDYQKHMQSWLNSFNLSQILILDSSNFVKYPAEELNKLEDFLGIKRFFTQNSFVFNSKRHKYCIKGRNGDVSCQHKKKGLPHPAIEKGLQMKLKEFFRPRNKKFFEMIKRNFSWGY